MQTPSPQAKYLAKRRAKGVRVEVQLDASEPDAIAAWLAVKALYGGQKPALLALLRSHVGATPSPRQGAVRFFAVAALLPEKEGLEFQAECEKHGDAESAIIALLRGKENG